MYSWKEIMTQLTLRETYDDGVQTFNNCWITIYYYCTEMKCHNVATRRMAKIQVSANGIQK